MSYMNKALQISTQAENCEGDNWTDVLNLCGEADREISDLKAQESKGMEVTLNQMLSKEQQERWGLDEHGHRRNVQHIFMRACNAIDELEQHKIILAKLAADTPQFRNPITVAKVKELRDNILKEGK